MHKLAPENRHITVKPHAANIMDQADLGVLYLDITGLVPELQNNRSHL